MWTCRGEAIRQRAGTGRWCTGSWRGRAELRWCCMWRRMWWWGRGSELRGPKAAAQESQTGFNSEWTISPLFGHDRQNLTTSEAPSRQELKDAKICDHDVSRSSDGRVSLKWAGSFLLEGIVYENTETGSPGRLRHGGVHLCVLEVRYPSPPSGNSLRIDHAG